MFILDFVQKKIKHLDVIFFFIRQKKTLLSCLLSIDDLLVEPIHLVSEKRKETMKNDLHRIQTKGNE